MSDPTGPDGLLEPPPPPRWFVWLILVAVGLAVGFCLAVLLR